MRSSASGFSIMKPEIQCDACRFTSLLPTPMKSSVYSCSAASASIARLASTRLFHAAASGCVSASGQGSDAPISASSGASGGAARSRASNA